MSTANSKKQRLLIQDLISNPLIYTRCASILEPSYFDQEYEAVVAYVHKYYEKYKALPTVDQIDAELDIELEETKKMSADRIESTCDEIEKFCKETAVKDAVYASLEDLDEGQYSKVLDRVSKAVSVSLQRDMGVNVWDDPEKRLRSLVEHYTPIPTGIAGLDKPLGGGLMRQQFTLFSANSGGGKSIMLSNLGANFALRNYNVLYISLELPPEMIFLRLASIITGHDASTWKENIPTIAADMSLRHSNGVGSYMIKRLPQQSTPADVRSYLTYYGMEYGYAPDILLLDYLDLMSPNGGTRNIGVFEQDKFKAEQCSEILVDYDCIGASASQQNREGLRMASPDQGVIAGGISKVNTVDNYISLNMTDEMRLQGEMNAFFLKTRSSSGVGKASMLHFNTNNLRISDHEKGTQTSVMPTGRKEVPDSVKEIMAAAADPDIKGLPGEEPLEPETVKHDPFTGFYDDEPEEVQEDTFKEAEPILPVDTSRGEALLRLMDELKGD
jgi:replicative DNA helicase